MRQPKILEWKFRVKTFHPPLELKYTNKYSKRNGSTVCTYESSDAREIYVVFSSKQTMTCGLQYVVTFIGLFQTIISTHVMTQQTYKGSYSSDNYNCNGHNNSSQESLTLDEIGENM
jgi:hypothetical protein